VLTGPRVKQAEGLKKNIDDVILGLLCLLLALVAALILVLYGLQRRELRSIGQLSEQLLASRGRALPVRLGLDSDKGKSAA